MIRVATVDRHPAVHAGLDAILRAEPDLLHVGGAADRYELWPLLQRTHPDVVVLEHSAAVDGLSPCLRITGRPGAPRVLLFGTDLGRDVLVPATLAGAGAIVDKSAPVRELVQALRAVAAGEQLLPAIPPGLQSRAAARLAPHQRAIFAMRLAGTSTADIASVAGLARTDVRASIGAIVALLGGRVDQGPGGRLRRAA
jgi:DNA-binding NarL/FixJ family response regulator